MEVSPAVVSRISGTPTSAPLAWLSATATRGLRLVDFHLVIPGIDPHHHLPLLHLLIVVHQNLADLAVDFRRNRNDVTVHLRVIGGLAIQRMDPEVRPRRGD